MRFLVADRPSFQMDGHFVLSVDWSLKTWVDLEGVGAGYFRHSQAGEQKPLGICHFFLYTLPPLLYEPSNPFSGTPIPTS